MSGVNQTRFLVQHKSCESKCELNEVLCKSKQIWNRNECCYERKELDEWVFCKNDSIWNASTCDCECGKARKIYKYLDIKKCLCKNSYLVN